MTNHIQHLFIINRAGSLIYSWEARIETVCVLKYSYDDSIKNQICGRETLSCVTVRFAAPTVSTNEKIILSSMFHSLFTIAVQLSPCPKSSGVEVLETTQFKLFCLQSRTGVKFVVITSAASNIAADSLLSKMYELYTDFALKNPFYSIDMPIRAQKFDEAIKVLLEKAEKSNGAVTF
ncbi:Protein CBG19270 [Caenorhabditis briggsae]|uniref:Trafficking protein particle complex subunit n=1 Tax=Caenorhabditis briggsae TaxID=6238 RepID=A8XV83_CAEBR|nr:Protein CBG19270 [Caenorhabditis briggsae]CAP36550.2 Protein CBG19270 [Caenorhabditis briggsae]